MADPVIRYTFDSRLTRMEERVQHNRELAEAWRDADASALRLARSETASRFSEAMHDIVELREANKQSLIRMAGIAGGATVAWHFISKLLPGNP